jgi:hypothetical protein
MQGRESEGATRYFPGLGDRAREIWICFGYLDQGRCSVNARD